MEMGIDSHQIGLERIHNKREEISKEVSRKKMSQEEFIRELVELKERLGIIMELL
jgi:hypothetical protein